MVEKGTSLSRVAPQPLHSDSQPSDVVLLLCQASTDAAGQTPLPLQLGTDQLQLMTVTIPLWPRLRPLEAPSLHVLPILILREEHSWS